jgi:hypothetical protein
MGRLKVGFFGHTHDTGIFSDRDGLLEWLDDSRVKIPACLACAVMVGAVGQSRHPTDRRACWVLWDPEERVVECGLSGPDSVNPLAPGLRLTRGCGRSETAKGVVSDLPAFDLLRGLEVLRVPDFKIGVTAD